MSRSILDQSAAHELPVEGKKPYLGGRALMKSALSPVKQARLKTLMGPLNMSDLACLVGATPSYMSMLLSGRRGRPSLNMAMKLAKVLHVTLDDLLDTLTPE